MDRAQQLLRAHEQVFLQETSAPKPAGFIGLSTKEIREYSLVRGALALSKRMQDRVSFASTSRDRLEDMYDRGPPLSLEEEASRSVAKAIGRETLPGRMLVPLEIQVREARDMTVSGVSGSNYLVGTSTPSFIAALRAASVTGRLGATIVGPLRDHARFPKLGTSSTYWLSDENTAITESQPTIGELGMTPKTVGAFFDVSHQLVTQMTPQAEAMLLAGLGADIAVAVDAAALTGTGTAGQPLGILATPGIGTFTGTSLGASACVAAQTAVCTAKAVVNENALGYVTTPAVAELLKARPSLPSTGTSPLWAGNVHAGTVEGCAARSTTSMTAATAIFGDWSSLLIAEWGILEIMVDPFTGFATGLNKLRALYHVDTGLRHSASFRIATSIT